MRETYNDIFVLFESPVVLVVISLQMNSHVIPHELREAATSTNDKAHLVLFHYKLDLRFNFVDLNGLLTKD